jgi:hypothetical protein
LLTIFACARKVTTPQELLVQELDSDVAMQRKDRGYFDPCTDFGARPRVKPGSIQPAPVL